ncbi:MAG: MFS transporter [Anaerolineae bacterium]|jgi:MFS family permease
MNNSPQMKKGQASSPYHVLLPAGLGTCLSLFGDASLYAVLPTHTAAAGVSVASVGILLSANRFVRLVLNGPAGVAYDRWRRRPLFVPALFVGACSTAIYGLAQGFWPLLAGRLLWGLAWAGIWVGGNTIILDITHDDTRGGWIGIYQVFFFLGASGGALLGGFLTDRLGYRPAMGIGAALTLIGSLIALMFLPETRGLRPEAAGAVASRRGSTLGSNPSSGAALLAVIALYGINRLVVAGVFQSTFGLFLLKQLGDQVQIGGRPVGVATLTGSALGLSTLIAMASAPVLGSLSDRLGNRWRAAAVGLLPGVAGFALLAIGAPLTILVGIPLTAITSGSNQGLSTALIGDFGGVGRQSRRLGVLFTAGDLASAVGPLLAYALIPLLEIEGIYLLNAGAFAAIFLVSVWRSVRPRA